MKQKTSKRESLDRLVAEWRQAPESPEALSPSARERILQAATGRNEAPAPLASLFLPVRRLALSAGLPAVALAMLLGVAALPTGPVEAPAGEITNLTVRKQGDEVIFVIANGGTTHRVYRSDQIDELGTGEPFATADSAFRDRIDSGNGLVYYRID